MLSNKKVLAMSGFAGSNENLGGGPVLDRGGMVYVSSSATRDDLASKLKNFYRVVPNNVAQAQARSRHLLKNNVIKAGDQAMVVDDAEAYAANQADDVQKLLTAANIKVDRESLPASTSGATANFSALANKAVAIKADIVFAPTQVASDSQLFAQQLKSAGYRGDFVAADGSFDPSNFKFPGAYLTYFGADVNKVRGREAVPRGVHQAVRADARVRPARVHGDGDARRGGLEVVRDGKTSRAEVRRLLPKVKLTNSILGLPIAFDNDGDLFHGPK